MWTLLMRELRNSRRLNSLSIAVICLTVASVAFASGAATRAAIFRFGIVFGNVVAIVQLGAELLRMPVAFPKVLSRRDWANDLCSTPLNSSCYTSAYARLAMASGVTMILLGTTAVLAAQDWTTISTIRGDLSRMLFYVYLCLYSYLFFGLWCGVAGGWYNLLPFAGVAAYAGFILTDINGRNDYFVDESWFHLTMAAIMFLGGVYVYYICHRTYADRLRRRLFP